jgi:hypothetical protein
LFPWRELAEDARRRLGYNIAAGAGGSQVFLYAGAEVAARQAERIARDVLARHHFQAEFAIHRWHPLEERWENPDVAMPRTEAERQAEHQQLLDDETAESRAAGMPMWEARVDSPPIAKPLRWRGKLRREGRAVVRRWKFLSSGQQRGRCSGTRRPDQAGGTSRR